VNDYRDLGYASLADYIYDIGAQRGAAHRAYLEKYHPHYANLPPALVPWPYRASDAPAPTHCPKCGRTVVNYWWGSDYHEVGCAGVLQPLLRRVPSLMLLGIKHWQICVAQYDRPRKPGSRPGTRYDPTTGEPMDGPAR
jgi:hypothetical protein